MSRRGRQRGRSSRSPPPSEREILAFVAAVVGLVVVVTILAPAFVFSIVAGCALVWLQMCLLGGLISVLERLTARRRDW